MKQFHLASPESLAFSHPAVLILSFMNLNLFFAFFYKVSAIQFLYNLSIDSLQLNDNNETFQEEGDVKEDEVFKKKHGRGWLAWISIGEWRADRLVEGRFSLSLKLLLLICNWCQYVSQGRLYTNTTIRSGDSRGGLVCLQLVPPPSYSPAGRPTKKKREKKEARKKREK